MCEISAKQYNNEAQSYTVCVEIRMSFVNWLSFFYLSVTKETTKLRKSTKETRKKNFSHKHMHNINAELWRNIVSEEKGARLLSIKFNFIAVRILKIWEKYHINLVPGKYSKRFKNFSIATLKHEFSVGCHSNANMSYSCKNHDIFPWQTKLTRKLRK